VTSTVNATGRTLCVIGVVERVSFPHARHDAGCPFEAKQRFAGSERLSKDCRLPADALHMLLYLALVASDTACDHAHDAARVRPNVQRASKAADICSLGLRLYEVASNGGRRPRRVRLLQGPG
jgi:hypothetical protein